MQRTDREAAVLHRPLDDAAACVRALCRDGVDLSVHPAKEELSAACEGIPHIYAPREALFELRGPAHDHRSPAEEVQDPTQHRPRC